MRDLNNNDMNNNNMSSNSNKNSNAINGNNFDDNNSINNYENNIDNNSPKTPNNKFFEIFKSIIYYFLLAIFLIAFGACVLLLAIA